MLNIEKFKDELVELGVVHANKLAESEEQE